MSSSATELPIANTFVDECINQARKENVIYRKEKDWEGHSAVRYAQSCPRSPIIWSEIFLLLPLTPHSFLGGLSTSHIYGGFPIHEQSSYNASHSHLAALIRICVSTLSSLTDCYASSSSRSRSTAFMLQVVQSAFSALTGSQESTA